MFIEDGLSEGEIRRKLIENAKLKTSAAHRRSLEKTMVKDGKKSSAKEGVKPSLERKKSVSKDVKNGVSPLIKKLTQDVKIASQSVKNVKSDMIQVTQDKKKAAQEGNQGVPSLSKVTQDKNMHLGQKVTPSAKKVNDVESKGITGTKEKKRIFTVDRKKGKTTR